MKPLVLSSRARSRDLFDLLMPMRDHGHRLEEVFRLVQTLAPSYRFFDGEIARYERDVTRAELRQAAQEIVNGI